jgi:hypothetical protein
MDHPATRVSQLRRWVTPLRATLLHPQWFIARAEAGTGQRLAQACGDLELGRRK